MENLPDEIIQIIASHYSTDQKTLEFHTAKNTADLIRLLSKLCISITLYTYYLRKVGQFIPEIKANIVDDICRDLVGVDMIDQNVEYGLYNLSIHFNDRVYGFAYSDFKATKQTKSIGYWYCCMTIFSTKETVEDFMAAELRYEELVFGLYFAIIGPHSKGARWRPHPYSNCAEVTGDIYFSSDIEPYSVDDIDDEESDDQSHDIYIQSRIHALIPLIRLLNPNSYNSVFYFAYDILKKHKEMISYCPEIGYSDIINLMTYVFRLAQENKRDLTFALELLLHELTLQRDIITQLKKWKEFNLFASAVHFNDVNILREFFLAKNNVIDPILTITKPYKDTKKEKRPKWMRFDREFADLPRERKGYKRDLNDRCNRKYHDRSFVDESKINAKELSRYELDD